MRADEPMDQAGGIIAAHRMTKHSSYREERPLNDAAGLYFSPSEGRKRLFGALRGGLFQGTAAGQVECRAGGAMGWSRSPPRHFRLILHWTTLSSAAKTATPYNDLMIGLNGIVRAQVKARSVTIR